MSLGEDGYSQGERRGLHEKFMVFRRRDVAVLGTPPHFHSEVRPLDECFVLRPTKDQAARRALFVYAIETDNEELRADLLEWLEAIRARGKES